MLVLTRKVDESITIGDEIKVKVLEIDGNKIKLGIEAPQDVEIHRQEIYEQIEAENKEAARQAIDNLDELMDIFD